MIINDLDGYYIVFDTKNWNTELDTLFKYFFMERYKMKYKYFMGVVQITFKVWSDGKIDIKLDDNFALSIGYGSAYAMKKGCKAFQMAINTDWARVDETGKIFLFSDKGLIPLGCCSIYGDWDLHY